MWSRPLEDHLTPLLYWATKSSWPQKWGGWGGLLSLLPHHQQTYKFLFASVPQFSRSEFVAQMLQSFCFRCHSFLCHGLLMCKARRWICLLPNAYAWGGYPWAWPCLSCLRSISFLFILFLFALLYTYATLYWLL